MQVRNSDYIYRRVEELASSGFYVGPAEIIAKVVSEGHPQAAAMFNTGLIFNDLRRQCDNSSTAPIPPEHWRFDAGRR